MWIAVRIGMLSIVGCAKEVPQTGAVVTANGLKSTECAIGKVMRFFTINNNYWKKLK